MLRVVNPGAARPFRAPLLPLFSVAGAAACLYLVTGLQVATWIRYGDLVRGRDRGLRALRLPELAAASRAHRALNSATFASYPVYEYTHVGMRADK